MKFLFVILIFASSAAKATVSSELTAKFISYMQPEFPQPTTTRSADYICIPKSQNNKRWDIAYAIYVKKSQQVVQADTTETTDLGITDEGMPLTHLELDVGTEEYSLRFSGVLFEVALIEANMKPKAGRGELTVRITAKGPVETLLMDCRKNPLVRL